MTLKDARLSRATIKDISERLRISGLSNKVRGGFFKNYQLPLMSSASYVVMGRWLAPDLLVARYMAVIG